MATSRGRGAKISSSLLRRPRHTQSYTKQIGSPDQALRAVMTDFTFASNPTTAVLKVWTGSAWVTV